MIAVRVTVPMACWRTGSAVELLETYEIPPPSTCYGMLLSLVGEEDRHKHRGVRVTAGVIAAEPETSIVLRSLWRVKRTATPLGIGENARPNYQQLRSRNDLVVWLHRGADAAKPTLEDRITAVFKNPGAVDRFGALSLGESTHLVNDLWLLGDARPPAPCRTFLLNAAGPVTMPTWVDHVGFAGTRWAVGDIVSLARAPPASALPGIG